MTRPCRAVLLGAAAMLMLAGCSTLHLPRALEDGPVAPPRDAEGRPLAPPPAPPFPCPTPDSGAPAASCTPVHNPPSRRYVEQAIPTLLPTRGYGSIEHVRCTDRIAPATFADNSHWTCVGREPEGTYLHQDVVWNPGVGLLGLNAVARDRSAALTVPDPQDPGLPNPHASETAGAR